MDKKLIIEKSAELFFTIGVKTTTMDTVANELGISKKTLYEIFTNKKQLVEEVSSWIFDRISEIIQEVQNKNYNPIEEYFAISSKIDEFKKFNNNEACNTQLRKFYPDIFNIIEEKNNQMIMNLIVDNYKKGVEKQLYLSNLNSELIGLFFISGLNKIHNNELYEKIGLEINKVKKEFIYYHLNGIMTDKGRDQFYLIKKQYQ